MKVFRGAEEQKKEIAEDAAILRDFIAKKKEAIKERAAEMADKQSGNNRKAAAKRESLPEGANKQDVVERYERARIEVQLLETQIRHLQPALSRAIEALANPDLADDGQASQEKTETARKEFDKLKEKAVELSKRLYQQKLLFDPLQLQMQSMGLGGMTGSGGFQ